MRKRNYKTIRGLMRQKLYGFLSVADVITTNMDFISRSL